MTMQTIIKHRRSEQMINEQPQISPWYRNPMVWLVIGIPLSSVFGGILFIYLAINNPNDVVKDNYYKDGLAINKRFGQDQQARDLGLSAQLTIDEQLLKIQLQLLSDNSAAISQPFVRFTLFHPTNSDMDISGAMAKINQDGRYAYQVNQLPQGRWDIQVMGDNGAGEQVWRLRSRVIFPLQSPLTLTPTEQ